MRLVVIQSREHRVLETDTPLSRKIILPDQVQYAGKRIGLLDRHQGKPFLRERVMQADGQVAAGLVQETAQVRQHADRRKRNALRAPSKAPVRRQDINGATDIFIIVQRFAHAHEHDIGKVVGLRDAEQLVQDVAGGQMAVETLASCHAELAAHLAAGLGRDAERATVLVRNHHRLDGTFFQPVIGIGPVQPVQMGTGYREKVFLRPVLRTLQVRPNLASYLIALCQPLPACLGKVGHQVDVRHLFLVEPLGDLLSRKSGKAVFQGDGFEFFGRLSEQDGLHAKRFFTSMQNYAKNISECWLF